MERESMAYDVVIVGAGPAGLAAAIRLRQLAAEKGREITVCVLEKGSEVGAHILSGAVIEPRSLSELIPDWKEKGAPLETPARQDQFLYLTQSRAIRLPTPPQMHNEGNYIVSLGNVCRWLAQQAEALGVDILPETAGAQLLDDGEGGIRGVITDDKGIERNGEPGPNFQPGVELVGRITLLAEGCRGSLTKRAFERFKLRDGVAPQTYGLGVKELWEVQPGKHEAGRIVHTIGWPLDRKTYGGSWLYHFGDNLVSVGFVVGLDYWNPYLSPFEEMQRYKTHPAVRPLFEGGRRIAYGARALSEGGFQSIPRLTFPGGAIIGDAAGFLNLPKIKGTHTAMKSGMVAAEAAFEALGHGRRAALDGRLSPAPEAELALGRAPSGAQHQRLLPLGPPPRPRLLGAGHLRAARQGALDPPRPRRQRDLGQGQGRPAHRLSTARRQAHLRPPLLGLPQQHQPRGGPARPPRAQGPGHPGAGQPAGV